jgi:predicted AlkP superfamily pyrophosphatase or phosphodiesterase
MYIFVQKSSCFLANALTTCAILVFAAGFFPHKAFLPGLAAWPAGQDESQMSPPFDRVIFMVVDALRRYLLGPCFLHCSLTAPSDFVYGPNSSFSFTQRYY